LEVDLTRNGGLTCAEVSLNPIRLLPALAPRLVRTRVLALLPTAGPDGLEAALRCMLRLMREGGHLSALRELRLHGSLIVRVPSVPSCLQALRELLADARALSVVEMQLLAGDSVAAVALLPLPRLRVRHFSWTGRFDQDGLLAVTSGQVLEQLERHEWLQALTVTHFRAGYATPELLERLVNVALTRHLEKLVFRGLTAVIPPNGTAPGATQLVRLVRESATLRTLIVTEGDFFMDLLPDALRVNTTLRELELRNAKMWCANGKFGNGDGLCRTLAGHPSLTSLSISCPEAVIEGAADDSLAALLDVDTPQLKTLSVDFLSGNSTRFGVQLPRMFEVLARNTHLRGLTLGGRLCIDRLRLNVLPAVRANTSLRQLRIVPNGTPSADALTVIAEAEQIVAARNH
jgi:hypothetical protein